MKKTAAKTITPKDLIYRIKPRTTPFGYRLGSVFKKNTRLIGTAGVYKIGQTFGGRIAMY